MQKMRKWWAVFLLITLSLSLFGCDIGAQANAANKQLALTSFDSYDELYEYLNEHFAQSSRKYMFFDAVTNGSAPKSAANSVMEVASADSAAEEYSGTNVQVEGIDEGDTVKTDGKYIYILSENEIVILSADGADSTEKARINVACDSDDAWEYVQEFYVGDGLLTVLRVQNTPVQTPSANEFAYWRGLYTKCVTYADIYDVSDMEKITLKATLGQDGSFITSRLKDGMLYVLSAYASYQERDKDDVLSFVPCLYDGQKTNVLNIKDIAILPAPQSEEYTIISAIDLKKGKTADSEAVLGGYCTTYMNADNLYLAYNIYEIQEQERSIDGKKVTDCSNISTSELVRVDLAEMQVAAAGKIEGYLINQFAMDEYDGYLRVAATVDKYSYRTYQVPGKGYTNYETIEDSTANYLYVLDQDLKVVGGIKDLAPDERIYSVRFDGEVGYFVTFRQVDPLFSVDLSDPAAPKVMGELKIPGFSEYLHVYGEDRLFGLGMTADEKTGRTGSMKLSMFDTAYPYNVSEKHQLVLESNYSSALYNHKAVLVEPQKDLIAFPVARGYEVYGYDDVSGFTKKAQIDLEVWSGECHGVYIGDYFYICNYDRIYVCDMTDFTLVQDVTILEGENEHYKNMVCD